MTGGGERPMDEARLAEYEADHRPARISKMCEGCNYDVVWPCDAVELVAELRRLQAQVQEASTNAVETLLGSCEAPDHHGVDRLSFTAFLATEGVRCALCVAAERDQARAEVRRLRAAGNALYRAFVHHRTATHEVKPHHCATCWDSDEALATWRALGGGDEGRV